ncbi:hypothetical protein [Phaeobacter sp. HF9A]|uniref:hypothetical protein n=1 Tax=Phaeobacter sp. HF9A TaxID=2721561 RepID=UPI001431B8B3|nr:hypothetical protein [Phaeobacter sp. HF9A]NIZ12714.1 hypothetical protein [Phaeobacter sp. HF9A]
MSEFVENVKTALADLRAWAQKNRDAGRSESADKVESLADLLEGVPQELIRLYGLTSSLPAELGNIHDLPPELQAELSVAKTDELEDQLVTVIKAYGDQASLDQILVGLFRKFQVTQKRRFLQNKLYRMETIWGVPGKKGVYTSTEPTTLAEEFGKVRETFANPKGVKPPPDDEDSEIPF